MHLRKKDCDFFSKILIKLEILANFFTTLLKVIFINCEKIWSEIKSFTIILDP